MTDKYEKIADSKILMVASRIRARPDLAIAKAIWDLKADEGHFFSVKTRYKVAELMLEIATQDEIFKAAIELAEYDEGRML